MPRGGERTGTPGKSYPNRSDMAAPSQPVTTAPSQQYGQRAAQEAAQQAMPLPSVTPPGSSGPLDRPSDRPSEPLTAGLSTGPGPGREALGQVGGPAADALYDLRRLYQLFPSDNVLALITSLESELGMR